MRSLSEVRASSKKYYHKSIPVWRFIVKKSGRDHSLRLTGAISAGHYNKGM